MMMRAFSNLIYSLMILFSPIAFSAPVLIIPESFEGVFGTDYPIIDPTYDIEDGDPASVDYFYEWLFILEDDTGNYLDGFASSNIDVFPLDTGNHFFFPSEGDYVLQVTMTTFHQVGGLPGCGPHSSCYDYSLPVTTFETSDYMNITLTSVPVPAAVWLFGSGLLGLIGVARRQKAA